MLSESKQLDGGYASLSGPTSVGLKENNFLEIIEMLLVETWIAGKIERAW